MTRKKNENFENQAEKKSRLANFPKALFFILAILLFPRVVSAEILTLSDALEMAMKNNLSIQRSQAELEEATAVKKSVRGKFGPSLKVEGNILRWDDSYELDPMDYVVLKPKYASLTQRALDLVLEPIQPIELRSSETRELSLTLMQPITPLFSVYHGYQAGRAGENARTDLFERTRREVAYKTIENYFLLLKVQELERVAQSAVDTISAHVDQAMEFYRAEFIGKNEILTAEVKLANARQMLIRAQSGVALMRSVLANIVGLPVDFDIQVKSVDFEHAKDWNVSLSESRKRALQNRKDLSALTQKAKAAKAVGKISWWNLTPQLAAIGRWQYTEGIMLSQEEERFVGLALKWDLWNWGSNYYEAQAENAKSRQVDIRKREVQNLIRLEVQKCYLAWTSADQRVEASRKAVDQAQENLRIQQLRFKENMATSVDVLDAQTLGVKAKSDHISARYDLLTSIYSLYLAIGESPVLSEEPLKASSLDRAPIGNIDRQAVKESRK